MECPITYLMFAFSLLICKEKKIAIQKVLFKSLELKKGIQVKATFTYLGNRIAGFPPKHLAPKMLIHSFPVSPRERRHS